MQTKPFWKSKTIWLNVVLGLLALVQLFQGQPWFSPGLQGAIAGVLNILVRFLTDQPVGLKPPPAP